MIDAVTNEEIVARVVSFPSGLHTVAYKVVDDVDHVTIGRTTSGVVEDEQEPGSYSATFTLRAPGAYRVIWDFGTDVTAEEEIQVTDTVGGNPAWKPTLADVVALIPSRAKGQFGRVATFDETTQPTGDQVQAIIDRLTTKFAGKFGSPAVALVGDAKDAIALRVAMLIELTYFGDQIRADRSPYQELKALYEEAIADFTADRANLGGDQTADTADDQSPEWSFPTPGADGAYTIPVPGAEQPIDPSQGPIW